MEKFDIFRCTFQASLPIFFQMPACVQVDVTCVRLHPEADLEDTLANNVAVLKLDPASAYLPQPKDEDRLSVRDLVGLRDSYSSAIVPELVSGWYSPGVEI